MSIRRQLAEEARRYGEIREKAKEALTKILRKHVDSITQLDGTEASRRAVKEAIMEDLARELKQWASELLRK